MFKEAGIDEASLPTLEKPWTWSEFNAIAKKLKDHFNKPAIDFRLIQTMRCCHMLTCLLFGQMVDLL